MPADANEGGAPPVPVPSVRTAATSAVRSAFSLKRSDIAVMAGLRCGLGVAIAFALALATGHATDAVDAAVGALFAGIVSLGRPSRAQVFFMGMVAMMTALTATVGSLADHSAVGDVVLLAVLGFVGGMCVCLGTGASAIGVQSITAAVVLGQPAAAYGVALHRGLFTLIGGVIQLVLVVVPWPAGRSTRERAAVAELFRVLGRYASAIPDRAPRLPDPDILSTTGDALAGAQPFVRSGELSTLRTLVHLADRLRMELIVLAGDRLRFRNVGEVGDVDCTALDTAIEAIADDCRQVADAVEQGRRHRPTTGHTAPAAVDLQDTPAGAVPARTSTVDAITHTLADALVIARSRPDRGPVIPETGTGSTLPSTMAMLRIDVDALRANLGPSTATVRHATRLAAAVAVAAIIGHLSGSPHGYWVPLTVAIVLRPTFGDTFNRGVARVAGTMVGAAVATLAVTALHPTGGVVTVMIGVVAALGCMFFSANYGIYAVSLTALVALLLSWAGSPPAHALEARVVATLAGGALALAMYALWPTWESTEIGVMLGRLTVAVRRYTHAVFGPWGDVGTGDPSERRAATAATRRARADAEASVARMLLEPHHQGPVTGRQAGEVLDAMHAYLVALVSLAERVPSEAHLPALVPVERHLLLQLDRITGTLQGQGTDENDKGTQEAAAPPLARPAVVEDPSLDPLARAWVADLVVTIDATAALLTAPAG